MNGIISLITSGQYFEKIIGDESSKLKLKYAELIKNNPDISLNNMRKFENIYINSEIFAIPLAISEILGTLEIEIDEEWKKKTRENDIEDLIFYDPTTEYTIFNTIRNLSNSVKNAFENYDFINASSVLKYIIEFTAGLLYDEREEILLDKMSFEDYNEYIMKSAKKIKEEFKSVTISKKIKTLDNNLSKKFEQAYLIINNLTHSHSKSLLNLEADIMLQRDIDIIILTIYILRNSIPVIANKYNINIQINALNLIFNKFPTLKERCNELLKL